MRTELDSRGFRIDGIERPLLAAQFEPFRQNPLYWPRSLDSIKAAGIDIVSIFICWDFHEVAVGAFDFDGTTNQSRDLAGFLRLCEEKQLMVWARPGPIMDDEWETRGPARDVMTLDRLHPEFLRRTEEYVAAVCRVLVPQQTSRGGPIGLISIDNEILYPYSTPESQAAIDGDVCVPYDDAYYEDAFRVWLKEKFDTIAEVNAVLGTSLTSWNDVHSPQYGRDSLAYSYEGYAFINSKVHEYTRRCRDMYLANGIDVPLNTNMKQLLAYIDWPSIAAEIDTVGMNLCVPRDMPGDQALAANWWIRLQRAQFDFAWSADLQAGWIGLDDMFGFISAEHSEYLPMASQAAGMRGANFYSFVERDDWNFSPVSATGKIRPTRHAAFRRVVASYAGVGQRDEQLADVGLLYSIADHQSIYLNSAKDWSNLPDHWAMFDEPKGSPEWWATFRRLVEADVDFRIWIPGVSSGSQPRILVHAGIALDWSNNLDRLSEAMRNCEFVVAVTEPATRTPDGALHSASVRSREEAERDGRLVRCAGGEIIAKLASLGAGQYVRAEGGRIWTFLYRSEDGALVVGAWNPGGAAFDGLVRIEPSLLGDAAAEWWIDEPRLGTRDSQPPGSSSFQLQLAPHSARVFRLSRHDDAHS